MVQAENSSSFGLGVEAWRHGLGKARDAVRQELVARQLGAHLPLASASARPAVLDIGCGQGTQALRLARRGFEVTAVDLSEELLGEARAAARLEPASVRARIRFQHGDLFELSGRLAGRFDVVCCHGVLMYLLTLHDGIAAVVQAARVGGLVSVLTRNRAGIAMRAGMIGDWAAAIAGFDGRYYRNRLGIDRVRADEPDEVNEALRVAGAEQIAWYGVRLFSDHWRDVEIPEDFESVVMAEEEAGRRDPYRMLAALTHTIALRR